MKKLVLLMALLLGVQAGCEDEKVRCVCICGGVYSRSIDPKKCDEKISEIDGGVFDPDDECTFVSCAKL